MPRISLSTATPIRALRAWENNLVIALDRWSRVAPHDLAQVMQGYKLTAIQAFVRYLGHWPEFTVLGVKNGNDYLQIEYWYDAMGEMLDFLPEHQHCEFVYPEHIALLLFGDVQMFKPRGQGTNNAGRHRHYEFRYRNPPAVVKMRLEEQLVAVRARIIAVDRPKEPA